MATKRVIIPLPDRDFDTTEVSIPWQHFVAAGLSVTFSTETGQMGQTDPRLLTGVIFGQLGAKPDATSVPPPVPTRHRRFPKNLPVQALALIHRR